MPYGPAAGFGPATVLNRIAEPAPSCGRYGRAPRLLRLADGLDEVHRDQLARLEYRKQAQANASGGVRWDEPPVPARALQPAS